MFKDDLQMLVCSLCLLTLVKRRWLTLLTSTSKATYQLRPSRRTPWLSTANESNMPLNTREILRQAPQTIFLTLFVWDVVNGVEELFWLLPTTREPSFGYLPSWTSLMASQSC